LVPTRSSDSPAATRSALAVARRPRVALHDSAPEQPVSETPAIRGTSAQRLARALGTEVTADATGNATVELPAPGEPFVPFSTAPRTVSRAEVDAAPTPAAPAASNGPAPADAPMGGAPAVDMDEIAENVIERLRRELLIEREQSGGSMDLI
jgi:hypothetical protein